MKDLANNKRVLVVGADGLIGRTLVSAFKCAGSTVLSTSRRERLAQDGSYLDLDHDVSSWPLPEKIDVAFFCVAYNSLDYCRCEPLKTRQVNVVHTVKLAERLVKAGARVVFLSTNLVFDGEKAFVKADAPLSPQTEHGRQKAQAEKQLLKLGKFATVVRFTKIFGPDMRLFQEWILSLQNNKTIHPFIDKVVCPLPLVFAVEVLCRLAQKPIFGIIQVSGAQDITYAEVAFRLARRLGVKESLVQPVCVKDSGFFLEHLPRHTTLDTLRLNEEFRMQVPDVWTGIDLIIDQNISTFESRSAKPIITTH